MRALALAFVAACAGAKPPAPPVSDGRTAAQPSTPDPALALIEASPDLEARVIGRSDAPATIAIVFASWCGHCRDELDVLARVRAALPATRVVGLNYRAHEEYAGRGGEPALRAYVAAHAPWLRVVPAGEALFEALGRPPKVPTIYVYDRAGALAARYDRRDRPPPGEDELAALLRGLDQAAARRR
ncbi:MAG TPA: TlpA disulfide reductase family protein [Kofleriaceae bacterium]|nr:TlpA disulfide reductase family protein [Kofleriaceae bacterium]